MASADMNGFYKQTKKKVNNKKSSGGGAPSSSSAAATALKRNSGKGGGVTVGASDAQTPALFAHGSLDLKNEYGEEEEQLRQFDMDMRYGPCVGLTRLQRWDRASAMGLHPPPDVRHILARLSESKPEILDSLWDGRV